MRKIENVPLKYRPWEGPTPRDDKIWWMLENKKCQRPSCSAVGIAKRFARHHWGYEGQKENPRRFPDKVHPLCISECHSIIHQIASMLILYLEFIGITEKEELVCRVAKILSVDEKDVRFVLFKEFKRAGIIRENKGKCILVRSETRRIQHIKMCTEIEYPGMMKEKANELRRLISNPG